MAHVRVKLTVRATPEQSRAVAQAARALGMTVNDYMLARALDKPAREEEAARLSSRLDALESGLAESLDVFHAELKAGLADALAEANAATAATLKEQGERASKASEALVVWVQKLAEKAAAGELAAKRQEKG